MSKYETLNDVLKADEDFMRAIEQGEDALKSGNFAFRGEAKHPVEALRAAFDKAGLDTEQREQMLWEAVREQGDLIQQLASIFDQALQRSEYQMQVTMTAVVQKHGPIVLTPEQAEAAKAAHDRLTSHPSADGKTFVYELSTGSTKSTYVN